MSAAALRAIRRLRKLRAFERQHLGWLRSIEERDLVCEIGHHQCLGRPLSLKQAHMLGISSAPTLQRRLRRLVAAGYVEHRRSAADRRSVELALSQKVLEVFGRYAALLIRTAVAEDRDA
jgi:DNA-binding MarR family transcriptional regulator